MSIHAATPAAAALRRHCATARGSMSLAKIDGADGAGARPVARALADSLPRRTVVPRELLETEGALQSRRDVRGGERRFDRDRAGAAHRVEQRRARRPAGEREHAGGEILAQRRHVDVTPPAALEQRFARRVEIERRLALGEVGVDAHVRPLLVDRRTLAGIGAEAVAHGILDLERRELEARERRARRREVDAQRARDGEVAFPSRRLWRARRARPRCDSVPCATCHRMRLASRDSRLAW